MKTVIIDGEKYQVGTHWDKELGQYEVTWTSPKTTFEHMLEIEEIINKEIVE